MNDTIQKVTEAGLLSIGGSTVTLGRLISAAVIVGGFFIAAHLLGMVLNRLRSRAHTGRSSIYIVQKLGTYALILGGLLMGLSTLGLNLTSLAVFAGAIGVGIGLGLQGIVREFFSGLLLIFDQVIHVGDFVELENGARGEIVEIGPRATRIRTNDNIDIVIPNSKLIDNQVTNWTLKGGTRRIHVPFSVAYGVDKAKVRDAVLEAARALPFTLPDTDQCKTQVWMTAFGESALEFELVVWPRFEAVKRPAAMQAAYTWAIEDALRKADIEVPFAQMDVRLRSAFGREGDEALQALGFAADTPHEEDEPPSTDTHNDAMDHLVASVEADRQEAREKAATGDATRADRIVAEQPAGR